MSVPASPPRTPSDWLVFLSDRAEAHRFETLTSAGDGLQSAFIAFLSDAGRSGADIEDLRADLVILLPRFCNALIQADHSGSICRRCAARNAATLFDEIIRDASELAARQSSERKH